MSVRVRKPATSSFALSDDDSDDDKKSPEQIVSDVMNGDYVRDPMKFFTRATDSKGHVFNVGQVTLPYPFAALAAEIKESPLVPLSTYAAIARDGVAHRIIELYTLINDHPENNPHFRDAMLAMEFSNEMEHMDRARVHSLTAAQTVKKYAENHMWVEAQDALRTATSELQRTPRIELIWDDFVNDATRAIIRQDASLCRIPVELQKGD